MGWSLTDAMPLRDPHAVDAALFAAGKALYLANAFEGKCRYVLRIVNLSTYSEAHPDASWDEKIASAAKDKMLHPTLERLKGLPIVTPDDSERLDKARDARNFIAHQGAAFGYVFTATAQSVDQHLGGLRAAVRDLAAGDNIVSRWVYEIDEEGPPPLEMILGYEALVEEWVFGDLRA